MTNPERQVFILGVGNPLYRDDGFGVEAVAAFEQAFSTGPEVAVIDGGTEGLSLLGVIEEATELVLLDAVAGPGAPGSLVEMDGRELAGGTPLKLSEHQVGIEEVLGLAVWRGRLPERTVLVGVVARDLSFGPGLTPEVAAVLPAALDRAAHWLQHWGVPVARKAECQGGVACG